MKKLVIDYMKGRWRKEASFMISDDDAEDPIKRASIISAKTAAIDGRVVNWRIIPENG
jgi:hypothetical protein